ncbi:MAG: dUTP diphosphatase [Actinomycetota bacterium]|nr:dUTP diphosphatase [Actinomycetota bacterium]
MRVLVKRLDPELALPAYARIGDAGMDLIAAESVTLKPGERAAIPTGIALALPEGYAGFVQPRSGRALNEGLGVANAPGLIDSGYRGEIKVIAINLNVTALINVDRGEKIAQIVFQKVESAELEVVDELPPSVRGEGGFGSTGR